MWILEASPGDDRLPSCSQGTYHLPPGTYTVGRDERTVSIVCMDDKAISRMHAEIRVAQLEGSGPLQLIVKDLSRYGTYLEGANITKGKDAVFSTAGPHQLRFGHKHFYRLRYQDTCICAAPEAKSEADKLCSDIGFRCTSQWGSASSHLLVATSQAQFSVQVACAILAGKPVVTLDWLRAWRERKHVGDPPPDTEAFKPLLVHADAPGSPNTVMTSQAQERAHSCAEGGLLKGLDFCVPLDLLDAGELQILLQAAGASTKDSLDDTDGSSDAVIVVSEACPNSLQHSRWTSRAHILNCLFHASVEGLIESADEPERKRHRGPASPKQNTSARRKRTHPGEGGTSEANQAPKRPKLPLASHRQTAAEGWKVAAPKPEPADEEPASGTPAVQAAEPAGEGNAATIVYLPLLDQKPWILSPVMAKDTSLPNFKAFRKGGIPLSPSKIVPFAKAAVGGGLGIDTTAFLNAEKERRQHERQADELFVSNLRPSKLPAPRGRGRVR